MKHDEKKIEEMSSHQYMQFLIRKFEKDNDDLNVEMFLWGYLEQMLEKYAEHMVQQERERIVSGIDMFTVYSIGRDEIGNVISKQQVKNLVLLSRQNNYKPNQTRR